MGAVPPALVPATMALPPLVLPPGSTVVPPLPPALLPAALPPLPPTGDCPSGSLAQANAKIKPASENAER
jgi:hypothetical protein